MKTVLSIFLFTCVFVPSIFANDDVYSIEIDSLEDANLNYSLAIYYKELASSSTNPVEAKENALIAKHLLDQIVIYLPIKEVYLNLAYVYEVLKEYDESIGILEDLSDIYYNDDSIFITIAERYLFWKEDGDTARYYFEKAYEINPKNNHAIIILGFLNYESQDYKEAVRYFSLVDDEGGNIPNYLINYNFYHAVSEFYSSQIISANKRLENVNTAYLTEMDNITSAFILIKTYQALEDYEKAYKASIESYNALSDSRFMLYAVFFSFLSDNLDDELFESVYSNNYNIIKVIDIINTAKTEGYEKALDVITVELERGNVDVDIMQLYYYLTQNIDYDDEKEQVEIDIITFYLQMGMHESVGSHLEDLLSYSSNEDYYEFYLSLADAYYKNDDYEESEYYVNKYLDNKGEISIDIQKFLVDMYTTKTYEYDKAISILNNVDDLFFKEAYMSYIFYKRGDYENSKIALSNYYDLGKDDLDKFKSYYHIAYGVTLSLKDKELSLLFAEFIFGDNKDNASYMNNYAWVLIELDVDVDKGIEVVLQALEYESKNEYALDTLGRGYYKKGEYAKALEYFFMALLYSGGTNNVEIFTHIADVYYKIGENENALFYYRSTRTEKSENELYDFDYINSQIDILTQNNR